MEVAGKLKTYLQIRRQLTDNITDESVFVARASEGSLSVDWVMAQPVYIRQRFVDSFTKELQERKKNLDKNNKSSKR